MTKLEINQFQSNLTKYLDLVIKGEKIIITQDNKPVAEISPIQRPLKRGSAKGKVWISSDFNEPLEDFKDYME
ncbi:type II toxin-antitoxin system prevent-host-death family antitoxin [Dolichospermum sp. ST_con]|jgi:prevent-host-death family protein|nr:type II toxin-antitoxin system prevent-host-death family antitoxin [Dolichospermum sp. DET66]MBS3032135.1 type II toxin-antitoxin system prevent-host-death family antitoxin [Dolichospermum sp. DET67]MBS3037339.1 type II toxin-antitoxin system prevent-host-death family antitoxin [Dolichospermum sp. DET50]MDD1413910.1 type II toxin-antitoxin system prevent-host-death family antitoxin [Dolichospermum sp. ST_con]MDD1420764.1 type II toxin-antitoxin system prevent-host-death family antitoxin [Dol